ncbi:acylneuraminate cytidylyltransferase [Clostridia bacterium]|nr:acylneuraminate cytidylyltransferase [Clostridia bacterium]
MVIAFIPVRGGSKSIPLKNIKLFNGKPLVYWTLIAACGCKFIDDVFVATDSKEIANAVNEFALRKVRVIDRESKNASDTASTESAMLEFAQKYTFDDIVLIQATSPLLTSHDLDCGFRTYMAPGTDSVLSAVRQKRFNWLVLDDGNAMPMNYDITKRPRRQEFAGYLVENGAFYITSRKRLLSSENRISGNIKIVEMPDESYYEIDELHDWAVCEALMRQGRKIEYDNVNNIKMFLMDCDGCLTDGGMFYSENGDELKKFSTYDGMGIQLLREAGILVGIITKEDSKIVKNRAEKLRLDIVETGVQDKKRKIAEICRSYDLSEDDVAYIGDDINDIEAISTVGIGACVANAVDEVKKISSFVTYRNGGDGAIREFAEYILNMDRRI